MDCNLQIHSELKTIDVSECPFCCELIDAGDNLVEQCCDEYDILEDEYQTVCRKCGTQSYKYAFNYIDFYENIHRFRHRSKYHRKYHIQNVLNDVCQCNNVDLNFEHRTKIFRIFDEISNIIPIINKDRKRLISSKFIIREILKLLCIPYKFIKVTRSRKTHEYYERYWYEILKMKHNEIDRIIN